MITKIKTSVSLSRTLLREMDSFKEGKNTSHFVEEALTYYIAELKRREQRRRDAARFNREAEENLEFQDMP